jgi:hypothetical protein
VFAPVQDEDGLTNVIVKPDVYQQYYKVLRNCLSLAVRGAHRVNDLQSGHYLLVQPSQHSLLKERPR